MNLIAFSFDDSISWMTASILSSLLCSYSGIISKPPNFFHNFGRILKPSLLIGGLRDNAIFEVTNWKPSDIRILLQSAYY